MAESLNSETSTHADVAYRFGGCLLVATRREILVDDLPIDVQPKVFDLLLLLIENRDRVVDKDELLDALWPGSIVTESSLTQAIRKARAIAGDDGDRQEVIRTVHRRGYRLVAPVEVVGAPGATSDDADGPRAADAPATRGASPWQLAGALALLIAVTAVIVTLLPRAADDPEPASAAGEAAAVSVAPPNSIAVLPFADMSEDSDNAYFADGLSEELLNVLANNPGLHVAARTSSFSFKDSNADIATIAERLQVAHVLEGSVRRAGNQVRITVQLIDSDSGYHVWSESFDRSFEDIFVVQQEIAAAVADNLQVSLLGDNPIPAPDTNRDAYTLFLQARYLLRQSTPDSIRESIEQLDRAVSLDPEFGRAWNLLGSAYIRQANFGLVDHDDGYALGRSAVARAIEADPGIASAHAQLAWISLYQDYDIGAARRHIERAIALAPRDYESISYAGTIALGMGQVERAITLREQVVAIDPLGRGGFHNLALAYYCAGRLADAERMYARALSLSPDYLSGHYALGLVKLAAGQPGAALAEFDAEVDEAWRLQGRALALHDLGRQAASRAALDELIAGFADDMTFQIGEVHAYLGNRDAAFDWLERAYARRDGGLWQISTSPLLDSLAGEERFDALLARMGLDSPAT